MAEAENLKNQKVTGIRSRKTAQVQRASDGKEAVWREAETQ